MGTARLLLPSVSVHIFDADGQLLLVRQKDNNTWSTPGGLIEPDERPADAARREAWEETGLLVHTNQLLGVYGGPECVVRAPSENRHLTNVAAARRTFRMRLRRNGGSVLATEQRR